MAKFTVASPSGKEYVVEAPDSASDSEILSYARSQLGYGEPQGPQRSLMGATKAALSRSAQNVGIGLTDDLPALAGAAFGFDDYARKQLEESQKARERLNVLNPREVESYKDVDSFGKGATYVAETIGEFIPSIGLTTTGVGAAALGARTIAGRAAKKKLAAEAKKLSASRKKRLDKTQAGKAEAELNAAVEAAKKQAVDKTIMPAAFLGSFAQVAPEIFSSVYQETGELAPAVALMTGSVGAALDSILPTALVRQFRANPALKNEVIKNMAARNNVPPSVLATIGKSTVKGGAVEGSTEGAQQALGVLANRIVEDNWSSLSSPEFEDILEATIRGAVGGKAFGAIGGVKQGLTERSIANEQQRIEAEKLAEKKQEADKKKQKKLAAAEAKKTVPAPVVQTDGAETPIAETDDGEAPTVETPVVEVRSEVEQIEDEIAQAEINKNEEIKRLKDELKPFNATFKKEGLSVEEETFAAELDEKITAAEEGFTVNLEALNVRKVEAEVKAEEAKATKKKEEDLKATTAAKEKANATAAALLGGRSARGLENAASYSVIPANERVFDPETGVSIAPIPSIEGEPLQDTEATKGVYKAEGEDITGKSVSSAVISSGRDEFSDGRGAMNVTTDAEVNIPLKTLGTGKETFLSPDASKIEGELVKTNMATKSSGWNWIDVPEGLPASPDKDFKLVTVENNKLKTSGVSETDHVYALNTSFPRGAYLMRGQSDKNPKLRPSTVGTVQVGNVVGSIRNKGRVHPVYDNVTVTTGELTNAAKAEPDGVLNIPTTYGFEAKQDAAAADNTAAQDAASVSEDSADLDSVERVRNVISARYGKIAKKVKVFNKVQDAFTEDEITRLGLRTEGIRGLVLKDTAYLFADNIAAGSEVAVFLHETGAHLGVKALLKPAMYNKLIAGIKKFESAPEGSDQRAIATRARARVNQAFVSEAQRDDELLAYFVEEAVQAGYNPEGDVFNTDPANSGALRQWFKGLVNAVRNSLKQLFKGDFGALTPQEYVNLAHGAAQIALSAPRLTNVQASEEVFYSSASNNVPVLARIKEATNSKIEESPAAQELIDNYVGKLSNAPEWGKDLMLSTTSLFQLADIVKRFNAELSRQITKLDELINKRVARTSQLVEGVNAKATAMRDSLRALEEKTKASGYTGKSYEQLVKDMNNVAAVATTKHFDFRKPAELNKSTNPEARALALKFAQLPSEMRDLLTNIVNENEAQRRKYLAYLGTKFGEDVAENGARSLSKAQLAKIQGASGGLEPYITLNRHGGYWLKYPNPNYDPNQRDGSGNTEYISRSFKNVYARSRQAEQLKKSGVSGVLLYTKDRGNSDIDVSAVPIISEFLSKLKRQSEGANNSEIEAVINSTEELLSSLYPSQSLKNQFNERQGTPGFEMDLVADFSELHNKFASEFANLEYADQVSDTMAAIGREGTIDADPKTQRVVNFLRNQQSYYAVPTQEKKARFASYAGYMMFIMGNISSAFMNLLQIPTVGYGWIGGKYGYKETAKELKKATKMYFNGGRDNNTSLRIFSGDLGKVKIGKNGLSLSDYSLFSGKNVSPEMQRLFARSIDVGGVRRSVAQESMDLQLGGQSYLGRAQAKANLTLGWTFQNTERANREILLVTAYNVIKKKYPNLPESAIQDRAIAEVKFINGPQIAEEGPKLVRDSWGKVFGTFKKFAFSQIYLQYRMFNSAYNNVEAASNEAQTEITKQLNDQLAKEKTNLNNEQNPDIKKVIERRVNDIQREIESFVQPEGAPSERNVALRQFLMVTVATTLTTGIRGMPLLGAGVIALNLLQAFGLVDEEDEETGEIITVDEFIRRSFGDYAYMGIASKILGVDVASRAGFHGMLFNYNEYDSAKYGPIMSTIKQLAGPTASIFIDNPQRALDFIAEGEEMRALEVMSPSFARNMFKAMRFGTEGALNRNGVPVVDDLNGYNIAMQFMGFTPTELAKQYRDNQFKSRQKRKVDEKASRLKRQYYMAYRVGDTDLMEKINEDINKFNTQTATRRMDKVITRRKLKLSVKARQRAERESLNGLRLTSSERAYLNELYPSNDLDSELEFKF